MQKTFIIFLCIIFFSQIQPWPVFGGKNFFADDQNGKSITKSAMKTLDELLRRIKRFVSTINNPSDNFKEGKTNTTIKTFRDDDVMENSGLFDGDIRLSKKQAEYLIDTVAEVAEELGANVSDIVGDAKTRKKRKIDTRFDYEWELTIPYIVNAGVDRNLVREALKKLESETCLRFQEHKVFPRGQAGLKYFPGDGCYSNVGRQSLNELQEISIGPGCNFIPTIQHETMHALGFTHEQSRADRDKYLKILINNVKDFAIENFLKLQLTDALDYGVPYDYGSAMHYNSHSFSKNGQPTMLPYIPMYEKTIGSKSEATFLDIMVLNLYYCEDICLNRITCKNNGYQDPNSCERCKCLKGFTGRDCSEIERNSQCENQELFADGTQKLLYVDGEKDCVYHIKSKSGNRILIEVKTVSINPTYDYSCRADNKLEVKFQLNKTTSGAFLCEEATQRFMSENDHVMIRYTSTKFDNFAEIYYKIQ